MTYYVLRISKTCNQAHWPAGSYLCKKEEDGLVLGFHSGSLSWGKTTSLLDAQKFSSASEAKYAWYHCYPGNTVMDVENEILADVIEVSVTTRIIFPFI